VGWHWRDHRHFSPWLAASVLPQGRIYAAVGDGLAVVQALSVDAQQNLHAMPGSLGHPLRRYSSGQPQGHCGMPKVVWPGSQRRSDLDGSQRKGPGFGPDVADGGRGDRLAPLAAEYPLVQCDAEGLDVRAQDGDQFGRDRDPAALVSGPVLEPRSPCAESSSVQRRLTSGRDFSSVRRPHPVPGKVQSWRRRPTASAGRKAAKYMQANSAMSR